MLSSVQKTVKNPIGIMYGWFVLEIAGLLQSNNLEKWVFQAAHLLFCHYRLVFKLFFATSTMLWTHLLQNLVSSLTRRMF